MAGSLAAQLNELRLYRGYSCVPKNGFYPWQRSCMAASWAERPKSSSMSRVWGSTRAQPLSRLPPAHTWARNFFQDRPCERSICTKLQRASPAGSGIGRSCCFCFPCCCIGGTGSSSSNGGGV